LGKEQAGIHGIYPGAKTGNRDRGGEGPGGGGAGFRENHRAYGAVIIQLYATMCVKNIPHDLFSIR